MATYANYLASINGKTFPNSYFYNVSASNETGQSLNGVATYNGQVGGFSASTLQGSVASVNTTTGTFNLTNSATGTTTLYQVHGSTADGRNLVFATTGDRPSLFVLSNSATTPTGTLSYSTNNSYTAVSPVCFVRGTNIKTPVGEIRVEDLNVGDLVMTLSGAAVPVRWIGSGSVIVGEQNKPVVIHPGAFGDNCPTRDLRVTRGHAFLFGGVLISVGDLVNDRSIEWDDSARSVEIFHIELDRHDILIADGAPAESYRDVGNRIGFGDHVGVGTRPARTMPTCAPLVHSGPIVDRTRRYLNERAIAIATLATEEKTAGRTVGN